MKPFRRSAAGRHAASACPVAVIVTVTRAGDRYLLMVRDRDGGEWRLPARAGAPGQDGVRAAVASLAEDAALDVPPSACQLRPAWPVGFAVLPSDEPEETLIPVLVPLGEVSQLPPVASGGFARAAGWFPAGNYPALHDALTAEHPGSRVLRAHEQLLAVHLGVLEPPGPDDHPELVADFIRRGHEVGVLEFLVECRKPETFTAAITAIPGYGRLRPAAVAQALGAMFGEFEYAEVGAEGGRAVIYMHLPYYNSQRYKNGAARAAAAADLRLPGTPGSMLSRRELDRLVEQAVRAGRRLGADEADGVEESIFGASVGVRKVRFWWN